MPLVKFACHKAKAIFLLSLLLQLVVPIYLASPCLAEDLLQVSQQNEQINLISEQILARVVELEKLNTYFRMEYAKSGKLRPWRQFVWIEANAGATEAGLIESEIVRWRYVSNPYTRPDSKGKRKIKPLNRTAVEDGLLPQMVGQFVGAAGSAGELYANYVNDRRAKKLGFDPHTFQKKVLKLKIEIDQLLARREKLVTTSDIDDSYRKLVISEGQCLKDIRDLALIDYVRTYVRARKLRTFENVGYVVDCAKNITGALGNLVGIVAAAERKPRLGGSASLLTLISGGLIIAIPISSRFSAMVVGKYLNSNLARDLDNLTTKSLDQFDLDRTNLEHLIASADQLDSKLSGVVNRIPIYRQEDFILKTRLGIYERELAQSNSITQENLAVGITVGGTKVALGVCGILAGWHYPHAPIKANKLLAAGTTAYQIGTAETLVETMRLRVLGERANHKLKKEGNLPGQVLQQHLQTLDMMEKSVATHGAKSNNPGE